MSFSACFDKNVTNLHILQSDAQKLRSCQFTMGKLNRNLTNKKSKNTVFYDSGCRRSISRVTFTVIFNAIITLFA